MKVVQRTDTVLELRESPLSAGMILVVFGIGGTWVLVHEGERLLTAGFVLFVLALSTAFISSTTCRFDRTTGELSCTRRTAFGTSQARHPLAEIAGVRTERSSARQSQAHRIVFDMSGGSRVPLTTHFSTGDHQRAAQVIREFLGLPAPA